MSNFVVDVEADGQVPHLFSMVCFGIVKIGPTGELDETFYGECRPISDDWIPEALAVSGFSREETMQFPEAGETMQRCFDWVKKVNIGNRSMFLSDNNGFDWQFMNYYFHRFCGSNPFGHSSTNIGSLYKGIERNMFANFKKLRKTKHTHHPVDDAMGNAEALLVMRDKKRLKIKL